MLLGRVILPENNHLTTKTKELNAVGYAVRQPVKPLSERFGFASAEFALCGQQMAPPLGSDHVRRSEHSAAHRPRRRARMS